MAEILKKKCNTKPNPDEEWLQAKAAEYVPEVAPMTPAGACRAHVWHQIYDF